MMTDQELIATARAMAREMRRQGFVDWPNVVDRLGKRLEEATRQPCTKTATDAPPPAWSGPQ